MIFRNHLFSVHELCSSTQCDDFDLSNLLLQCVQLFTGQKKQPVIVPMYAAGLVSRQSANLYSVPADHVQQWSIATNLQVANSEFSSVCLQGMLEPTKEPVKPVSAAEMIASIAQVPPVASENSSCPADTVQVRVNWCLKVVVILIYPTPPASADDVNLKITSQTRGLSLACEFKLTSPRLVPPAGGAPTCPVRLEQQWPYQPSGR